MVTNRYNLIPIFLSISSISRLEMNNDSSWSQDKIQTKHMCLIVQSNAHMHILMSPCFTSDT